MERKDFYELAEQNGVNVIEVTSGINGYPEGLRCAIIGFDSFEDAEKMAREHGLDVMSLRRRDGWQFWEREGRVDDPYDLVDILGEDVALSKMDDDDFEERFVLPVLEEGGQTMTEKFERLERLNTLWAQLLTMDDDEVALLDAGGDFDRVTARKVMDFSEDVWHYAIAVM